MYNSGRLKLNLLENAYDYLNVSLIHLARAREEGDQNSWKSALLNISFCIELMLKERLRREHPLLIYADIDRYKPITRETKTVSWSVLIERLRFVLGNDFVRMESGRLTLAQQYRNQMLHYDVFLEFPSVYHDFSNLLNFTSEFFDEYLKQEEDDSLHQHIRESLWLEEDLLIGAFEEGVIYYNDIFMPVSLMEALEDEQEREAITLDGEVFERIRYGAPEEYAGLELQDYASRPCGDCSARKGQLHLIGCDLERCPKCGRQLLTCRCKTPDFDKMEMPEEFHRYNDQFFDSP